MYSSPGREKLKSFEAISFLWKILPFSSVSWMKLYVWKRHIWSIVRYTIRVDTNKKPSIRKHQKLVNPNQIEQDILGLIDTNKFPLRIDYLSQPKHSAPTSSNCIFSKNEIHYVLIRGSHVMQKQVLRSLSLSNQKKAKLAPAQAGLLMNPRPG